MTQTKTTGSCLCEGVKFQFTGAPAMQIYLTGHTQGLCHCITCRKVTGSTNTSNVIVPESTFSIVIGSDKLVAYNTTHENGMVITLRHCQVCGSTIYKTGDAEAMAGLVFIQAGLIDGAGNVNDFKAETEWWTKHRVPWVRSLEADGVKQCEEFV